MRKINKFLILCSSVVALAASSIGITYAIYRANQDIDIEVNGAILDAKVEIKDLKLYSANASLTSGRIVPGGDELGEHSATYYYQDVTSYNSFLAGGTATLNSAKNKLIIDKISAGDMVSATISVTDLSTIKTKYRLLVEAPEEDDLFSHLDFTYNNFSYKGFKKIATNWNLWPENTESIETGMEISLPLKELGIEKLSTSISFAVEVMQCNMKTNDVTLPKIVEDTNASLTRDCILYPSLVIDTLDNADELLSVSDLVYNADYNLFGLYKDGEYNFGGVVIEESENNWLFKNEYVNNSSNPIYLLGEKNIDSLSISSSVDLGKNAVSNLSYSSLNEEGKSLILATNNAGTNLVINDGKDLIKHYGVIGNVEILKSTGNYQENGKCGVIGLHGGAIDIQSGSDIESIYIHKETVEMLDTFNTPTIKANSLDDIPNIIRDSVGTVDLNMPVCYVSNGTNTGLITLKDNGYINTMSYTDLSGEIMAPTSQMSEIANRIANIQGVDLMPIDVGVNDADPLLYFIGNTKYQTIAQAFAAANDGDTIILLNNSGSTDPIEVDTNATISVESNVKLVGYNEPNLYIPATLNLFALTANKEFSIQSVQFEMGGRFTRVKNGINSTVDDLIEYDGNPISDLRNGKHLITVTEGGKLSLLGGTVFKGFICYQEGANATESNIVRLDGKQVNRCSLLVDGAVVSDCMGSSGLFISTVDYADVVINSGTFKDNALIRNGNFELIKIYAHSTLVMNGGSFINNSYTGNGLVGAYQSTIVMNGGSFVGNYGGLINTSLYSTLTGGFNNNFCGLFYFHTSSSFVMNGGEIINNDIYTWRNSDTVKYRNLGDYYPEDGEFNIVVGPLDCNGSAGVTEGVYTVDILGGTITGNYFTFADGPKYQTVVTTEYRAYSPELREYWYHVGPNALVKGFLGDKLFDVHDGRETPDTIADPRYGK